MVLPQLVVRNGSLFRGIVGGFKNVLHQPLITGGGGEHAAHEVIPAVGMGKGVECVVLVDAELLRGDEHGAGGAEGNIAAALAHNTCTNRSGGVVPRTGADLGGFGNSQQLRYVRLHGADAFVAFKQLRHLLFRNTADGEHFLRPALMLNVQQEHAGSIGVVAAVDAGQDVVYIILRQHDLGDLLEVLGLVLLHPQKLGSGEPGEGDVGSQFRQLLLADFVI